MITSVHLHVNDLTIAEDEVEVHVAVVDPDAVVTFGHSVVGDIGHVGVHVVLHLDDFQWIQRGCNSNAHLLLLVAMYVLYINDTN